jgi:hypothetical protein
MAVVLLVQTAMRKMRQRTLSHALGVLGVAIMTRCWWLRCCCSLLPQPVAAASCVFQPFISAACSIEFAVPYASSVCAVPQQMACA